LELSKGMIIRSVTGDIPSKDVGFCDAHNHLWIEYLYGSKPGVPVLNDYKSIACELTEYHHSGGGGIVDCQPEGSGRDGRILNQLSKQSGVLIIACTGFHLPKYYPEDFWLFSSDASQAEEFFCSEIAVGLKETLEGNLRVRAGFIKIACQEKFTLTPQVLLEGAAAASFRTGAAIEVHTEKGSQVEDIVSFFEKMAVPFGRIVLCHMDKRPDFGLHCELARAGFLLEYDTFYRPRYNPEQNLWPLLAKMVSTGLSGSIALGTDMAESGMWSHLGSGPGLTSFLTCLQPRLERMGIDSTQVVGLLGKNIINRLSLTN
jgi:predicted metal-dependent phosphotriesterase family hydrolase